VVRRATSGSQQRWLSFSLIEWWRGPSRAQRAPTTSGRFGVLRTAEIGRPGPVSTGL
jgi:hypothetical protein